MPPIHVVTYQEAEGDVPLHDWLRDVGSDNRDAAARCRDSIVRLAEHGHAPRRPSSAPLRDEVHELRARIGKVHYRVLYFFNGRGMAVLTSGCTKEGEVPDGDIDRAVRYKNKFRADPERHTYRLNAPRKIGMMTMTSHAKPRRRTAMPDAATFLDETFGNEAGWSELVERARVNRDVAHALYELRTAHHLTQRGLAELIGTKQPVIARLEDADYEGHSVSMLNRIAAALNCRVKIEFVPLRKAR